MKDLVEAAKRLSNTSLKTILDELSKLRETPFVPPKPKRRKTDIRTRRKRERLTKKERRLQVGRPEDSTLKAQFYHLRREVLRRKKKGKAGCWDWELKLTEWVNMWGSCPAVEIGLNTYKPAWLLRGRQRERDVQLKRIDVSKPWCLDNLMIVKGKQILYEPQRREE